MNLRKDHYRFCPGERRGTSPHRFLPLGPKLNQPRGLPATGRASLPGGRGPARADRPRGLAPPGFRTARHALPPPSLGQALWRNAGRHRWRSPAPRPSASLTPVEAAVPSLPKVPREPGRSTPTSGEARAGSGRPPCPAKTRHPLARHSEPLKPRARMRRARHLARPPRASGYPTLLPPPEGARGVQSLLRARPPVGSGGAPGGFCLRLYRQLPVTETRWP